MKHVTDNVWRTKVLVGWIALLLVAFLEFGAARACNVPVFRYALERWSPDPYRVTLFHRGALSEAQRLLMGPLEESSSGQRPANVVVRFVDVDDIQDDADHAMFASQSPSELPWLLVQYPQGLWNEDSVRSSPLTEDAVASLLASPLRTELIRRLADGQTAVWLMLECGQADKDDAVAAQLNEELNQLSQRLQLPELTSAPEDALLSTAPLQVTFSLLRVPRGVAAEKPLVEMLLGSEPDLTEFDEPIVFPVFGRGRALLPLIGAGITADNIHESAAFLVGACSCEIKELNPGFDLLLAADWDVLFFKEADPADRPVASQSSSSGKPELVAIPAGAPSVTTASQESASNRAGTVPSAYLAGVALVGLLVIIAFMTTLKRFA